MLKMFGRKPPFCGLRIRDTGTHMEWLKLYTLVLEEDQHATYGFLRAVRKSNIAFEC
jgi:hypothetical protein